MAAVRRRLDAENLTPPGAPNVAEFLDLVALGTVADVVPLDCNNRVLVSQGLRRIRAGRCVAGITALLTLSNRRTNDLTAADLAFAVAPRLNAAGRMDDMTIGIQCLLSDDPTTAQMLAARLDQLNQERRETEARMQVEALAAVARLRDTGPRAVHRSGVCLYDESWHQGVVGLVASRVKDRVRRPVIAFASASDETLRGSARSMPGIHIRDVLDAVAAREPDLISKFGGHAMAAGLTLDRSKLDRFAKAFDEEVARWAERGAATDAVETDGELSVQEIALGNRASHTRGRPVGPVIPRAMLRRCFRHPQYPCRWRPPLENVGGSPTNGSFIRCNCIQPHRRARQVRRPGGRRSARLSTRHKRVPGRAPPAAPGGPCASGASGRATVVAGPPPPDNDHGRVLASAPLPRTWILTALRWKSISSNASSKTSGSASPPYGGFFEYDNKKERLEEVSRELEDPAVWTKPERAQELGRERAN